MIKTNTIAAIMLIFAFLVTTAGAEIPAVELDASDVNCRSCHTDTHVIHSDRNVQCQKCHGETLEVRKPRCTTCHNGPVHGIHIKKVESQPCSGCHSNIQGKHDSILGDSICGHCHKDMIGIHGGEFEACDKCHGSIPKITRPLVTPNMTVVCENCHQATSIAAIHGSKDDAQTCYRCHREGVEETQTVKIPHIIHVPAVDCMKCHWDINEDTITVPTCSRCHEVEKIHSFAVIGRGMKEDAECSICHPDISIKTSMGELTEVPGRAIQADEEKAAAVPTSTPPLPGFGIIKSLMIVMLLYFIIKH